MVKFCLPQDLPASVFSARARGRPKKARARAMCLRASDPAGHHGWGGRWMRCGRRPGFRGDPPYLVRQAQVPFPGECIPPALSPRLPDCGSSNLRRNALSGLQNGRRGPSRRFSVERGDRDCRKPGEIADLTLSSGRGPGRVSSQMRTIKLALTPL